MYKLNKNCKYNHVITTSKWVLCITFAGPKSKYIQQAEFLCNFSILAIKHTSLWDPLLTLNFIWETRLVKRRIPERSFEPYPFTYGEQTRHVKVLFAAPYLPLHIFFCVFHGINKSRHRGRGCNRRLIRVAGACGDAC